MKKVFVVILHYKGKHFTRQCLLSLQKAEVRNFSFETVVVDNNSSEPIDEFKKEFGKVIFLKSSQNLGFAGGNNLGIKYALKNGADYVLILNNDTLVDKDLLVQLIKAVNLDSRIGILGPKIYFAPGYEYHQSRYKPDEKGKVFWYAGGVIDWQNVLCRHQGVDEVDKGQYDKAGETDFVTGCAMLVKKEVFDKVGLLDERYFLYLEDAEFCQRTKVAGFKIIYQPKGRLSHFNAGSSRVGGALHDYYFSRNRLLFGLSYAPLRAKIALIRESIRLLLAGRKWQRLGVRDFWLRKFGKGSYQ